MAIASGEKAKAERLKAIDTATAVRIAVLCQLRDSRPLRPSGLSLKGPRSL